MPSQNRTCSFSAGLAYLIAFRDASGTQTPVNTASLASTGGGDFYVRCRKNNSGLAQGLNPAITSTPATPPITNDWIHVAPGSNPTLGSDRNSPDAPHTFGIVEMDVWCNTSGELVILTT